jgi:hypothetical protein
MFRFRQLIFIVKVVQKLPYEKDRLHNYRVIFGNRAVG